MSPLPLARIVLTRIGLGSRMLTIGFGNLARIGFVSDAVERLIWVVLLPLSCRNEKWASTP